MDPEICGGRLKPHESAGAELDWDREGGLSGLGGDSPENWKRTQVETNEMHTISTVSIALYIYLYFLWAWRLYTIMIIIYDTIAHLKLSVRSRAIFLWELCEIDAIEMKRRKSIITIISNVRAYICIWLINSADYIASRTWNWTGRRSNAFSHGIFFCFFL